MKTTLTYLNFWKADWGFWTYWMKRWNLDPDSFFNAFLSICLMVTAVNLFLWVWPCNCMWLCTSAYMHMYHESVSRVCDCLIRWHRGGKCVCAIVRLSRRLSVLFRYSQIISRRLECVSRYVVLLSVTLFTHHISFFVFLSFSFFLRFLSFFLFFLLSFFFSFFFSYSLPFFLSFFLLLIHIQLNLSLNCPHSSFLTSHSPLPSSSASCREVVMQISWRRYLWIMWSILASPQEDWIWRGTYVLTNEHTFLQLSCKFILFFNAMRSGGHLYYHRWCSVSF